MCIVFYLLTFFLRKNYEQEENKISSFECGFFSLNDRRISFSVQFFLFALIFLIFDVVVSLLLPSPIFFDFFGFAFIGVYTFLLVLLIGLYFE